MRKKIFIGIIAVLLLIPMFLISHENKPTKYQLSICAVFKNEEKYLKEWIEFHRLVGVDHFFLYNLTSGDRYFDVLRNYIKEGIVTLIHWPDMSKDLNEYIWALSNQIPAYENAIKFATIGKTKWLVFVDIDEFLLPMEGNSLREIVEKYEEYPGIILSRIFLDASRKNHQTKKNLVLESTDIIIPPVPKPFKIIEKVIFKPSLCDYFTWPPYHFVFKDDLKPIELSKWELRINSYLNRSQPFAEPKRFMGSIQMDYLRFEQEVNGLLEAGYEIEDHSMERFLPNVRKKMGY